MFSINFSRFHLCYLPQDGTRTAHPHPCHCYKHLLMGWKQAIGMAKTGRVQQRNRRGTTMTKSTGQDNTNTDNEGTDDNGNNDNRTGDEDQQ
jgi:hypothetical protein